MPRLKELQRKSSKIAPFNGKVLDGLFIEESNTNASEPSNCNLPTSRLLVTCSMVALVGGFHFGFQLSITNPLAITLSDFIVHSLEKRYAITLSHLVMSTLWAGVVGVLFVGAMIGASFVPKLIGCYGCRTSVVITSVLMMVGIAISLISWGTDIAECFVISRLLIGISIGMGMTVQGVLITELSPDEHRGFMGMLTGLFVNAGVVIGSILGLPHVFGASDLWPLSYIVEALPCLAVLIFASVILEESPIYHLRHCHDEKARLSLLLYHGIRQNTDLIIKNMKAELESSTEDDGLMELLREKSVRWALLFGCLINLTVSFSGITSVSFFGTFILTSVGFSENSAALANSLSTLSGTAGAILGSVIIDKIGRRPMLIGSTFALALLNAAMMLLAFAYLNSRLSELAYIFLALFNIFQFTFATALGPVAWFIGAELSGPLYRSRVTSVAISTQYLTCFLAPIIHSPLNQLVGPFSSLLFIVPLLSTCLIVYLLLPETRNKSVEEIEHLLSVGRKVHSNAKATADAVNSSVQS
ncbi:hypothetical protein AB6A40_000142 [Gnathostoma spinigerum]|uniref:Major facilitator superfamily (MFS) profile domain-containing protein n=1 Tax=Gnathostoma spinigerum TaxID=75299 RepID=A0ABD6E1J7_9BILA